MADALLRALIERTAATIDAHESELTALDQAIGDGDHGINMKRGFEAVKADAQAMAAGDLPAALHKLGMTLVMKVGGASGPLYGTLFMALAKAFPPSRIAPRFHHGEPRGQGARQV
jgi:dihydroxyacetone kinase-like protein